MVDPVPVDDAPHPEDRVDVHRKIVRRRAWLHTLEAVLVVVIVGILIVNTTALLVRGFSNRSIFERLQACTTPHHKCFDENVERTKELIIQLEQSNTASAFCAKLPSVTTIEQMDACVRTQVAKMHHP